MEIGVNAEVEPVRLFSMEQVNSELSEFARRSSATFDVLVAYTMHLVNQSKHTRQKIADLEANIPEQENLQDVMHWALLDPSGFLPQVVADVIIQDEFTHDVIVPWRDEVVLVYDTT